MVVYLGRKVHPHCNWSAWLHDVRCLETALLYLSPYCLAVVEAATLNTCVGEIASNCLPLNSFKVHHERASTVRATMEGRQHGDD